MPGIDDKNDTEDDEMEQETPDSDDDDESESGSGSEVDESSGDDPTITSNSFIIAHITLLGLHLQWEKIT